MLDPKQLPFLMNLLDDESEVVQHALSDQLNAFGESLKTELARLALPPSPEQRRQLQNLMQQHSRAWLRQNWREWLAEENEVLALEKAMSALSEFQTGFIFPTDLSILLDDLAADFKALHGETGDGLVLAQYLFKDLGIRGAQADYHNPLNSGLVYVIKEKRGIPLSMTVLYILVGARLGMVVQGCNFPGHFLARIVEVDGSVSLLDCFNGGAVVDHKVVAQASEQTPWGVQGLIQAAAPTRVIVRRALSNLIKAYVEAGQQDNVTLMMDLSEEIEQDSERRRSSDAVPASAEPGWPRFRTGEIVRNATLHWRGVIVDFDMACHAPDAWYAAHGRKASKDQPWYHIFIDGSQQVGYAAEDSLEMDPERNKVLHPLIPHFFARFEDGKFERNQRPWPGTL